MVVSASALTASEWRAGLALGAIFFLRMLALFLLLPVMALAASGFDDATPLLVGLAFGVYGLTQASLQIPFGMLSDRWGRKPVIALGLLIFAAGSVLAAGAESILLVILGRALQGAGAIAAAIMALAADLSRAEQRTRLMALIGVGVGLAFGTAFVVGPTLYALTDIRTLFLLCTFLALLALLLLYTVVPDPPPVSPVATRVGADLWQVARNPSLLRLNMAIFVSHMILMVDFSVFPLLLRDVADIPVARHWRFYLPMLALSVVLTGILLQYSRRAEQHGLRLCMLLYLCAHVGLFLVFRNSTALFICATVFFCGFNYLEAALPAMVARVSPPHCKGAALGVYNTAQFAGIFFGGVCGGMLQGLGGHRAVFAFCILLSLVWAGLHGWGRVAVTGAGRSQAG